MSQQQENRLPAIVPPVRLGAGSIPAVQQHVARAATPVQSADRPAVAAAPVQMGDAFISPAVARHLSRR